MNHGLMTGMIVGGIVLSSVPIALGIGIGIAAFRHYRAWRASGSPPQG